MHITGLDHTSHITADASVNNAFYTGVLGLRRTWKTVNFDNPRVYHLAYGDRTMTPGTNVTFFEHRGIAPARPGRGSISETALRVGSETSLEWWADRLQANGRPVVRDVQRFGRPALRFSDPESLPLMLIADGDQGSERVVWPASPVPEEHQLHGLDSVTLTVDDVKHTAVVLQGILDMRLLGHDRTADGSRTAVYGLGDGGPGREVHVRETRQAARHHPGAGSTHHVAFHAPSLDDVDRYATFVRKARLPSSGVIDRTFFHNLYFREPGGTLIEIAAEVPGRSPYASDDEIGNRLVLPDHLEAQREAIERQLHPLDG